MCHRNAPLTPTGRLSLARCVIDDGWSRRQAAERFGVSPKTAHKWARRYREAGAVGMADRPSRPRRSPAETGDDASIGVLALAGMAVSAYATGRGTVRVDVDTSDADARIRDNAEIPLEVGVDGRAFHPAPSARDLLHLTLEAAGVTAADCHLGGGCWAVGVPATIAGRDGELWISDADARIDYPLSEHAGWLATWNPGGLEGSMDDDDAPTVYESECTDAIADTRRLVALVAALQKFAA
ncbi:hypothetical protein GCM10023224_39300 [Streptomonospora halophila]|uniref:DNA-binding domain-containing protein n=1 Tax=Streptomonospora halophila TaxID=427369 RepID=A0ABP9GT92_9ACTN